MDPAVLSAVASGPRRRILRLVLEDEMSAGELASRFDISWPAVSQHLAVLRKAGLVEERRKGKSRLYSTNRERLGLLYDVLTAMWESDLDRLAELAESEERRQ